MVSITYAWREDVTNAEMNALHAEAFDTRVYDETEWDWVEQLRGHSLGWATARDEAGTLVGFVNVPWDGLVHAWIQDTMVASAARRRGIGVKLVASPWRKLGAPAASGCTSTSTITSGPSTSMRAGSLRRTWV